MKRVRYFSITAILFCFYTTAYSQVCSGSLGDPVVNMTFGSGGNGAALPGTTTTYSFTPSPCPDDGSYTIVSSSTGCFGGTWHNITEDHTPDDSNGFMMLVNASYDPGDFYVDTVKGLCGGTTYEFTAWITNVLLPSSCSPPILPRLVFNIETTTGTVLGTYSTGDINSSSSPTWKQYGLFFTTPANTGSVVIRLTNTAPGGCGNDIALDDITFRPCGPSVSIAVNNTTQTTFDFCTGATAILDLTGTVGTGYISPAVQWQESLDNGITWKDIPNATTTRYVVTKTAIGTYKYRLAVADGNNIILSSCRINSGVASVTIHDLPTINPGNSGPVCESSPISLSAAGGVDYVWSGPASFTATEANPRFVATLNTAGRYDVMVTDQYGCINTGFTTIAVDPQPIPVISSSATICEGDTVRLTAGGGKTYLWSPAQGLSAVNTPAVVAYPIDSTLYSVVIGNNVNCTITETVQVNVLKKPRVNAGNDKVIIKGSEVVLDGVVSGTGISYAWSPAFNLDNAQTATPKASPVSDITYTLGVNSTVGCGNVSDDVFVKVYNDIYIPKAFSPNNDGLNDTWHIEALAAFPEAKVVVYNRFGQLVFESSGLNRDWDGFFKSTPMPVGAYTYLIDLKTNRPVLKGMVVIVR